MPLSVGVGVCVMVTTEQDEWERLLSAWDKATEDITQLLIEAQKQEKGRNDN